MSQLHEGGPYSACGDDIECIQDSLLRMSHASCIQARQPPIHAPLLNCMRHSLAHKPGLLHLSNSPKFMLPYSSARDPLLLLRQAPLALAACLCFDQYQFAKAAVLDPPGRDETLGAKNKSSKLSLRAVLLVLAYSQPASQPKLMC
eukprot:scaffold258522_cov22-Tisochrysis_lutea.AAC.1